MLRGRRAVTARSTAAKALVRGRDTFLGTHTGQLALAGTVTGDVSITDPGAKGDYLLINEAVFADAAR